MIQNELIGALYQNLVKELATVSSFSVMMDEASDFGRKEQVLLCCGMLTPTM